MGVFGVPGFGVVVLYLGFKSLMYSTDGLLVWLKSGSGTFTPGLPIYFAGFEVAAFLFFWFGATWLSKIMAPTKAADLGLDTRYVAQLMTLCISVFGLIFTWYFSDGSRRGQKASAFISLFSILI